MFLLTPLRKQKQITTTTIIIIIIITEVPVIRFDDVSSSCSTEGGDGEIYLILGPVEGLGEGDQVIYIIYKYIIYKDIIYKYIIYLYIRSVSSSCSTEGGDGEIYLILGPVEGLGEGDQVIYIYIYIYI